MDMIQNISVLGAGTMGHGIASVFAMHGYRVNLYESFDKVREGVMQQIWSELQFMVEEGYIPGSWDPLWSMQTTLLRLSRRICSSNRICFNSWTTCAPSTPYSPATRPASLSMR